MPTAVASATRRRTGSQAVAPRTAASEAVQDGSRGDGGAPDSGEVPPPARTCAAPRGRQERRAGRQAGGVGYVLVEGQQLGVMVMGRDPGS